MPVPFVTLTSQITRTKLLKSGRIEADHGVGRSTHVAVLGAVEDVERVDVVEREIAMLGCARD